MISFARLREQVEQARIDALVIVGDDQKEIFSSLVTGFTVYTGERMAGKKYPGRVMEVNGNQEWISVPNQREVAQEILDGLAKNDFDVAFFDEPKNREDGFGHAFGPSLMYLTPSLPVKPAATSQFLTSPVPLTKMSSGNSPGKQDATIDKDFDRRFWLCSMGKS
jgi:hypothetical protein